MKFLSFHTALDESNVNLLYTIDSCLPECYDLEYLDQHQLKEILEPIPDKLRQSVIKYIDHIRDHEQLTSVEIIPTTHFDGDNEAWILAYW